VPCGHADPDADTVRHTDTLRHTVALADGYT